MEHNMPSDETAEINNRVKAAMRQQTGPLTGSKEGTVVRSPYSTKLGDKPAPGPEVNHSGPENKR
jgi:hypothetical protein